MCNGGKYMLGSTEHAASHVTVCPRTQPSHSGGLDVSGQGERRRVLMLVYQPHHASRLPCVHVDDEEPTTEGL